MNEHNQDKLYKKTYNKMGYMTTRLDEIALAFIDFVSNTGGKALEIGAAFGNVAIAAADKKISIVVNDLDQRHLDDMLEQTSVEQRKYITPLIGEFPSGLDFKSEKFSAILICRVLHFFSPEEWVRAVDKIFDLLEPGGKVFITNESPYFGTMRKFIPVYEKRKETQYPWPGLVFGMRYFDETRKSAVDATINLLSTEETKALLEEAGFEIEEVKYLDRKGFYPDDALYDGRESVFAIAKKPE